MITAALVICAFSLGLTVGLVYFAYAQTQSQFWKSMHDKNHLDYSRVVFLAYTACPESHRLVINQAKDEIALLESIKKDGGCLP